MQLTKYEQDGLELYVEESSGLAFAHFKAIARMLGLDGTNGTLRRRLELVPKVGVKTAEIQTTNGLKLVPLYPASVVFKLALEFNPDLAEAMGACGANVYLLGRAGYKVTASTNPNAAQPQLPPHVEAVQIADSIRHITDTLGDNPRLAQVLIDSAINPILERQSKLLGSTQPQLRGVVEIATEMGYRLDLGGRVKLGLFVAKLGYESKKENRLCNGVSTPINCYEDTPELRDAIRGYFS
jgi:hypothetical protein